MAGSVSLALRSGIDPSQIVEDLRGITCCPVWDSGTLVRSAPDAVGLVLEHHVKAEGPPEVHPEQQARVDRTAQLGLFPSSGGGESGGERYYLPSAARCPKCSGNLIHQQ